MVIESFRGNARIIGHGRDQREGDRAQDHPQHRPGTAPDRADREAPLELDGDPERVIIRTNQNRASGLRRVTADMEITVPKGAID